MEKYKRNPNCKCKICEREVYKRPKEIKKGNIFCSKKCYGKYCQEPIECLSCKTPILKGLNKKTCSEKCLRDAIFNKLFKQNSKRKDKVYRNKFLKIRLIEIKGTCCERCKYSNTKILHVHHKIPKSKGGSDELENLELICPNCHAEEHYG